MQLPYTGSAKLTIPPPSGLFLRADSGRLYALQLRIDMSNKTLVGLLATALAVSLVPVGISVQLDRQGQARTEAKAASILAQARVEAAPGAEVAVVLGCYTKYCKLAKGQMRVLTPRGEEKWLIEHGELGVPSVVPTGFTVVRCHCAQPECLIRKDGVIWMETRTIQGFTTLEITK